MDYYGSQHFGHMLHFFGDIESNVHEREHYTTNTNRSFSLSLSQSN